MKENVLSGLNMLLKDYSDNSFGARWIENAKQYIEEQDNRLKSLAGMEAWIYDDEMKKLFQRIVYDYSTQSTN